jgi:hypothetical protein
MTSITLCPLRQHPELATFDDDGLQLFVDVLGVDMYRNWDSSPATTEQGAWLVRQHLDAERLRQAQADDIALARAELDQAAYLGPLRRKLDRIDRRAAAHAAVEADLIPFEDERRRDWERRADEKAAVMFATPEPTPVVDDRTSLERLKAKEAR